jgi:hypothetical protein
LIGKFQIFLARSESSTCVRGVEDMAPNCAMTAPKDDNSGFQHLTALATAPIRRPIPKVNCLVLRAASPYQRLSKRQFFHCANFDRSVPRPLRSKIVNEVSRRRVLGMPEDGCKWKDGEGKKTRGYRSSWHSPAGDLHLARADFPTAACFKRQSDGRGIVGAAAAHDRALA